MYGIIGSAKIPKPIINKINAAIVVALKDPEVVKKLNADSSTPVFRTGARSGFPTQSLPERCKAKKRSLASATRSV